MRPAVQHVLHETLDRPAAACRLFDLPVRFLPDYRRSPNASNLVPPLVLFHPPSVSAAGEELVALDAQVVEIGVECGDDLFERSQASAELSVFGHVLRHGRAQLLELGLVRVEAAPEGAILRVGGEDGANKRRGGKPLGAQRVGNHVPNCDSYSHG